MFGLWDTLSNAGSSAWDFLSNLGRGGGEGVTSDPWSSAPAQSDMGAGGSIWDKIGPAAKDIGKAVLPGLVATGAGALVEGLTGGGSPKIRSLPRSAEQTVGDQNKANLSTQMVGETSKYASDPNYGVNLNDWEMKKLLQKVAAAKALTGSMRDTSTSREMSEAIASYMAQRRGQRQDEFAKLSGAANAASTGFSQPAYSHLIQPKPNMFGQVFGKYGVPTIWSILDRATGQKTLPKITERGY